MTSLKSFTLFSSLPTELRLKIWTLSLPGPRIVPLKYTYAPANLSHRTSHDRAKRGCTSPTLIPSNLHTNQEARNEALLSYSLSFNIPHGRAKIFFNPSIDILYFGPKEGYLDSFKQFADASSMIVKSELAKVHRLAVHENLFSQSNENVSATRIREFWEYAQRKFENVQEVVVVTKAEGNCCSVGGGMCEITVREALARRIEGGLKYVRRWSDWEGPKWCLTPHGGSGIDGLVWPCRELEGKKGKSSDGMKEAKTQDAGSMEMAFWSAVL
jgi:hypothetical protein